MDKTIKKIINYFSIKMDEEQRKEFLGDVTELVFNLLKQTNKFNIPKNMDKIHHVLENVSYSIDCNSDFSTTFKLDRGTSKIDIEHFEHLLKSLLQVAHRTYHYAQCYSVDDSKKIRPELGLLCEWERFNNLKYIIFEYGNPEYTKIVKEQGKEAADKKFPVFSDVMNYIDCFSMCQKFEIEARSFATKFIDYIISQAKKEKLSEIENMHVELIASIANPAKVYEDYYQKSIKICQNPKVKKELSKTINFLYSTLLMSYSELKTFMGNKKPFQIVKPSNIYDLLSISSQMFEFVYDDEKTKTLLNTLFKCPQTPDRDKLILLTAGRTEIRLTDGQKEKLANVLRTTKLPVRGSSLTDFLKEKTRVYKERKTIEQGTFAIPQAVKIQ